ncbi:conditioned medium factor (density-sensing factor) [Xanthomonas fragariae]|nr:conditioned medium factor (density-sensing factor) [Xanthomonas fragariae]
MEELLAHTINAAHAMQAVDARELSRVIVDTTVQEKAIAYPTDSRLLEVARKKLVLLAKRHGIGLRQSYARQGPALSRKAGRYAHARQFKRMRRVLRRQRTVLGRLMRDIQRKLDARARLRGRLQPALAAALDRVFACLDAGDGMVILERRAAVTDGTWRLKGIFQGRLLTAQAGQIDEASLRVIDPQGGVRMLPMADDGRHDDSAADDGVYGGTFQATIEGTWIVQVIVHGHDQAGQPFVRTSEHVLPVLDTSLRLLDNALSARAADGTRLSIALPVAAHGKAPSHYRVFGQVWGTDTKGKDMPVAWIGGMLSPQQGQLPLSLDERWIARVGARAPFTLRALRIEDPDYYIPLVQADTLPLQLPALRRASIARATAAIDESMRMGPRPIALASAMVQPQAVGSQLVLVHGYCSSGVWSQAQLTNASSFIDAKQNRSSDQFAQQLAQFASQWSSFATVAHSQGGMAALHLYTYTGAGWITLAVGG